MLNGGGCLREVAVHGVLTLPFIRSTFMGTLNHSSMELVLNTQIVIVISDKFEFEKFDPVFSSTVVLIHDASGHDHNLSFSVTPTKYMCARVSNGFIHFQVSGYMYK